MIATIFVEFGARGLTWARVLVIGFLMPEESYGFLILLITGEALFGAIVCYPQIKDLLLHQKASLVELSRTVAFFLILSPFMVISTQLYFGDLPTTAVVVASGLLFALSQVMLYMLRVSDISRYNQAKTLGAIASTAVFFLLLPRYPLLLPLVSTTQAIISLGIYIFRFDSPWDDAWSALNFSESVGNWLIFGFQAAVFNLVQYGSRFVIGLSFSAVDVAVFTKSYMIAGGIAFYHSAMMVVVEKDLSRKLADNELPTRLRKAVQAFTYLFAGSALYFAIVLWVLLAKPIPAIEGLLESIPPDLFLWFAGLFVLQAVFSCINPVVVSLGRRTASLTSSVASLATQAGLVAFFWNDLTLTNLAIFMVAGQLVTVVYLLTVGLKPNRQRPISG